jgi:hypothetical protein
MTEPTDTTAIEALEEMRLMLSQQNPKYLADVEKFCDVFIAGHLKAGDNGKVLLMFLALRISAAVEKDEI